MNISFKIVEGKDSYGDDSLFFEVHSDALVVAREDVSDGRSRDDLARSLYAAHTEVYEWGPDDD